MARNRNSAFLDSLPNSENDFLAGIPDSTPQGLSKLSASATPTIDAAEFSSVLPQDNLPSPSPDAFQPISSSTPASANISPERTAAQPVFGAPDAGYGVPSEAGRLASEIYTPTLQYGGAAAGGIVGETAAGPFGAVGGASLGYAGGSQLSDYLDQLINLKPPPGAFFSLPTREQVKQETSKVAGNLIEGANLEMTGRILNIPIEATLNGLTGVIGKGLKTTPEIINKVQNTANELGINLTPAEISQSRSLSTMESVLDNVPWTSGIIQEHRLGEMKKLNDIRDRLISQHGAGKDIEELGIRIKNMADNFVQKLVSTNKDAQVAMKDRLLQKIGSIHSYDDLDRSAQEIVQTYAKNLNEQVSSAYSGISKKMGDATALPQKTLEVSDSIIKNQSEIKNPSLEDRKLLSIAKGFTTTQNDVPQEVLSIVNNPATNPASRDAYLEAYPGILNPGQERTYQQLWLQRKQVNDLLDSEIYGQGGARRTTQRGKYLSELASSLKEDMNLLAKDSGNEELLKAHQIADELFKKKLALFEDPAFKAVNDKYPGAVSESILKSGNIDLINKYRDLIGKDLFGRTKDRLTNDIIGLVDNEIIIGDDIRKEISKLGPSAKAIYSDQELQYFQNLSKAVDARDLKTEEILHNPFIRTIIKRGDVLPAGIANSIVKPNASETANIIEHFFGTEGKKKVADAFLPELLSTNQTTGDFKPQTFAKVFNQYGEKTIEAWYGKDFTKQLKDLAFVSERMGAAEKMAGNPSGTGRFMTSYYETKDLGRKIGAVLTHGSLIGAGYGSAIHPVISLGGEGIFLLGMRQLAKLYTTDAGKRLFIKGLITPATSKYAALITSRILSIITNELTKNSQGASQ